jgi:hypothetical protein
VQACLHLAESDLKRAPGGGRRLADALCRCPPGLGRLPDILARLTDFFIRMALLFCAEAALLSVLALSLGLLVALFSIRGIDLLYNLYHRSVQNRSETDAFTGFAP